MKFSFVVVYELPKKLTDGFGIRPITFKQVDWFGGDPSLMDGLTQEQLTAFIKGKAYYRPALRFLVLDRDTSACFIIEASA